MPQLAFELVQTVKSSKSTSKHTWDWQTTELQAGAQGLQARNKYNLGKRLILPVSATKGSIMLKSMKTGVSTTKRVCFQKFFKLSGFCHGEIPSVMAVPLFLLVLALCCRSTCQIGRNSEKSNHRIWEKLPIPILPNSAKCPYFAICRILFRQSGHRNSAKWARQLSTSAKTDFLRAKIQCAAYPMYARSPSPSQRPAPTTIASRSLFPLGLCSCSTSLSKMGT